MKRPLFVLTLLLALLCGGHIVPPSVRPAEPPVLSVEQVEPKKGAKDDVPTVTLPKTLSGDPGIPIRITAETNGANVLWLTPDKGLVVIDGSFFNGESKRAILFGPTGTYRLWAFTAKGDAISAVAECVVTVGSPVPPGPGPNPPGPTDPLTKSFQDAYDQEKNPAKLKLLIEAFDAGSMLVGQATTAKQLFDAIHKTLDKQVGVGGMAKTRNAVGTYLESRLPTAANTPLDGAAKTVAMDALSKVTAALKGVTP